MCGLLCMTDPRILREYHRNVKIRVTKPQALSSVVLSELSASLSSIIIQVKLW